MENRLARSYCGGGGERGSWFARPSCFQFPLFASRRWKLTPEFALMDFNWASPNYIHSRLIPTPLSEISTTEALHNRTWLTKRSSGFASAPRIKTNLMSNFKRSRLPVCQSPLRNWSFRLSAIVRAVEFFNFKLTSKWRALSASRKALRMSRLRSAQVTPFIKAVSFNGLTCFSYICQLQTNDGVCLPAESSCSRQSRQFGR